MARDSGLVPIPCLPGLADIDGVQQVGTRTSDGAIPNGAEVWDGQRFDRWLRQEKVADRSMGRFREAFQLFQGRLRLTGLPFLQLGKPRYQCELILLGALTRPAVQVRLDGDASHSEIITGKSKFSPQAHEPAVRFQQSSCQVDPLEYDRAQYRGP